MQNMIAGAIRKKEQDPRDWQFADHQKCKAIQESALPKKVSLKSKFPKVYTQTVGCCTTCSVLGCDDYYYHSDDPSWVPSLMFAYYNQRGMIDLSLVHEDTGSSIYAALKSIREYGSCNSKIWPNDKPFNALPSKEAYDDGIKGKEITKFYAVKSLAQLKKALAAGYPVAFSMVYFFGNAWVSYDEKTYIMKNPTPEELKKAEKSDLAHALIAVGYDDNKKLVEFRNSWGEQWGNKGYAYFTYDIMKKGVWWDDTYAVTK